jgi:hypothetical protein
MIDCMNCMNYKTKKVTDDGDIRADSITIRKLIKTNGAVKIFFCDFGHRNHSNIAPAKPIRECKNYNNADEEPNDTPRANETQKIIRCTRKARK